MEKVYQIIEEEMKTRGVESQIANSGEDLTLRIMPENMGPDEDGVVITEVCRVPVEDEEYDYFQIYTTVAKEVGEEVYPRAMLKLNEIKTKEFAKVLDAFKLDKALVVLDSVDMNVILSARNIPSVKTTQVNTLNTYDVMKYDTVVVTKKAVSDIEEVYA